MRTGISLEGNWLKLSSLKSTRITETVEQTVDKSYMSKVGKTPLLQIYVAHLLIIKHQWKDFTETFVEVNMIKMWLLEQQNSGMTYESFTCNLPSVCLSNTTVNKMRHINVP